MRVKRAVPATYVGLSAATLPSPITLGPADPISALSHCPCAFSPLDPATGAGRGELQDSWGAAPSFSCRPPPSPHLL